MRVLNRLRQQLRQTYGRLAGQRSESERNRETRTTEQRSGTTDIDEPSDPQATEPRHVNTSRSEADLLLEDGVTPRKRFVELMDANGGWLRQKQLVKATNLSKATVSRTLSTMESEGDVTRRRVGRENIVYLPGCEPNNPARAMHPETDDRSAT